MDKKKSLLNKIFIRVFLVLLIIFSCLYISNGNGYFEYTNHKNMVLTNEKIKEFEEDVKSGKKIDIKEYVDLEEIDYSSSISNLGYNVSSSLEKVIKSGMNSLFKFLNDMSS